MRSYGLKIKNITFKNISKSLPLPAYNNQIESLIEIEQNTEEKNKH